MNCGMINQITVNVPSNEAAVYAEFAVMTGGKSIDKVGANGDVSFLSTKGYVIRKN